MDRQIVRVALVLGIVLGWGVGSTRASDVDHPPLDPAHPIIGTLESNPARISATTDAGARAVVVGISWDRYEPGEGTFDSHYLEGVRKKIDAFRAGGKLVSIDLGVQYPPAWIFKCPGSHFQNQYGESFDPISGNGDCGVNLVFSQEMRNKFDVYLNQLFHDLGNDFYAVRLGGGRYGELGYPGPAYQSHPNCYWGFDPIAQGQQPGLPSGEKPCPVPGWMPGANSPNHDSSRQFLKWYMESMQNYHDWQITAVRKYFAGPLFMLYPSIGGMRPGQMEAAVDDDCNGSSQAEKTGEVQRGFDMELYVAGISDRNVVVYSTWIDGFFGSDDKSSDPRRWSPAHFLASLAVAHQPPLLVGGENTGHPDDLANMQLTFQRIRDNHLCVMFWAFEPTLFDGKNGHGTIGDFKAYAQIAGTPANQVR